MIDYNNYNNFTTPIFYTSGKPHIGHYYTIILADLYKRYSELSHWKARLQTGTDEHGLKIKRKAEALGTTPQELVNGFADTFKSYWDSLGIKYDDFIRTTEDRHKEVVIKFWNKLFEKGDIYLGTYKGLYCVDCEQYYKESDLDDQHNCPIHKTNLLINTIKLLTHRFCLEMLSR